MGYFILHPVNNDALSRGDFYVTFLHAVICYNYSHEAEFDHKRALFANLQFAAFYYSSTIYKYICTRSIKAEKAHWIITLNSLL